MSLQGDKNVLAEHSFHVTSYLFPAKEKKILFPFKPWGTTTGGSNTLPFKSFLVSNLAVEPADRNLMLIS